VSEPASKHASTPSLTISFVWTLAGSVAYAGSQWLLIVLFAKLGSPAMVGQYAFAAAIAYPLSLFANLQLRAVFVNDREGRYTFDQYLGLRYVLVGIAWIVLVLTCLFVRSKQGMTSLLIVVGTSMLVDSISESYFSMLQKNERMDRIGRSQIFRNILGLVTAIIALQYTHSVVWAASGMLFAKSLILMIYDAAPETFRVAGVKQDAINDSLHANTLLARFRPCWNFPTQRSMLWAAFPLGTVSVLVSLNVNIPRYIIEHYLGARDLGIYSALNYVPQAGILIASALGYVTYARLGKFYFERNIRGFRLLLRKSVLICSALGIVGLLLSAFAGRTVLTLLYRREYADHWDLFMWLTGTGALAFVAVCFGYAITAASQFRPQIPLFLAVVSVSAVSAFLLVPRIGLYGAAFATLASIAVQLIGSCFILQRALKKRMLEVPRTRTEPAVPESALASRS
jgi:O-antigen/teichoic acid export membrane protein